MEVWDHAPVARMVKRHLGGIVLAAKASITNASAEALNSVVQMLKHVAHGYRNRERFRNAIYFHLGDGQRLWQLDGPSREPSPHRALHDAGHLVPGHPHAPRHHTRLLEPVDHQRLEHAVGRAGAPDELPLYMVS